MVAYLALGIPRALVLGILTAAASLIPSEGTGLVWFPVAMGLALTGHWGRATIMVAIGLLVIGLSDNLLRPPALPPRQRETAHLRPAGGHVRRPGDRGRMGSAAWPATGAAGGGGGVHRTRRARRPIERNRSAKRNRTSRLSRRSDCADTGFILMVLSANLPRNTQ